jgi:hypothetical protein
MIHRALLVVALAIASYALGLGCAGPLERERNAIITFESWYSCPASRVTATQETIAPPADVVRDPDRFALWQRTHEGFLYFRVEGCGSSTVLACVAEGWCKRHVEMN